MSDALRIIPLGGLGEVGKNMTLYEFGGERILIDAGLAFPRDEHLGVDLVLPDFSYLESQPLLAIVLTHGHEDHVGALPYVLREVEAREVIGTKLTLAMVKSKLDEHGLGATTTLREADPDSDGMQIGPFKLEYVRMAHSIPDCVAIVVETPAGSRAAHGRLEARSHAGGRPQDRRREARGDGKPRHRPHARRLDQRRAPRDDRLRAPRRRGLPAADPGAHRAHPGRELRLEHPPHAAGGGGRDRERPQGRARRPLAAEEHEHRAQPGLREPARGRHGLAEGGDGASSEQGDAALHREPGRADVGVDADRLRRPPERRGRARRHGDHLGQARARQRAARPRLDQPARASRRRGAARGDRDGARLGPRVLGGDANAALARASQGADADPRRVPHARGSREARTRGRHSGGGDHHRRERLRGGADAARRRHRRLDPGRCHVRRRPRCR